jgi:hypothetical protein
MWNTTEAEILKLKIEIVKEGPSCEGARDTGYRCPDCWVMDQSLSSPIVHQPKLKPRNVSSLEPPRLGLRSEMKGSETKGPNSRPLRHPCLRPPRPSSSRPLNLRPLYPRPWNLGITNLNSFE